MLEGTGTKHALWIDTPLVVLAHNRTFSSCSISFYQVISLILEDHCRVSQETRRDSRGTFG